MPYAYDDNGRTVWGDGVLSAQDLKRLNSFAINKSLFSGKSAPQLTVDERNQGFSWVQDGTTRTRDYTWQNAKGPPQLIRGKDIPVWRKTGAVPPTPAPAPAASAPAPAPPSPSTAPGNPALSIPGVDVRLTGENLGIKSKNSSARISGKLNKGTSRLTIPRSSGANSLNFG
jgi:hypothetical protein